jgi:formylglycine-generating enzyme required for sulfatase activity
VAGGLFKRDYDGVSSDNDCPDCTKPDSPATVSDFRLDDYEVTVGRFRAFVQAVVAGWVAPLGSGKHGHLNGGGGLNGGTEPGWTFPAAPLPSALANWNQNLRCDPIFPTWTEQAGSGDNRPINCVAWQEAAAFCIWDGGFLPSDAEWNYAASGGSEQRVFPWSTPPAEMTLDPTFASFGCGSSCSAANIRSVGSLPKGLAKWGQAEMGGNLIEWNLDWDGDPPKVCSDCANVAPCSNCKKMMRGGSYADQAPLVHAANIGLSYDPSTRLPIAGFRCARSP